MKVTKVVIRKVIQSIFRNSGGNGAAGAAGGGGGFEGVDGLAEIAPLAAGAGFEAAALAEDALPLASPDFDFPLLIATASNYSS